MLDGIKTSKLNIIPTQGGDVFHGIKSSDDGFNKFGEVYFSWIKNNHIKAWKKHKKMTLNLVVPYGLVKFVFYKEKPSHTFRQEIIGNSNYYRLTVPPGIWFGFKGLSNEKSLVVNIADIEHDANEVLKKEKNEIEFCWD